MPDNPLIITVKQLKGEDGYRTFSVRLRGSLVTQMDEVSSKTGRSRNELIGIFLEYALEHCELKRGDHYDRPGGAV